MTLVSVIITIALVGVLLWAINTYLPMEANIKKLLNIVVIIIIVLWLLNVFGILSAINVPIGTVR